MAENLQPKAQTWAQFLATIPPDEQERFRNAIKHSWSYCHFNGSHIPHPQEKENLFEAVFKTERYIIDTNLIGEWKAACANPENRNKAFIISPPLSHENQNTEKLLFKDVPVQNNNVFLISVKNVKNMPVCMVMDRLDEHYRTGFDEALLQQASKGQGPHVADWKEKQKRIIASHKAEILKYLNIETIEELPEPAKLRDKIAYFKNHIAENAPKCRLNFYLSCDIANCCYCVLLMEKLKIRTGFAKPDYPNVFSDMYMVKGALYLQARILTKDDLLKRMAGYASIGSVTEIK